VAYAPFEPPHFLTQIRGGHQDLLRTAISFDTASQCHGLHTVEEFPPAKDGKQRESITYL